jgi:hypothetical protein
MIGTEERTHMPVLHNPRHEKFSQLVASGLKPTEAYVSLGYSKAGAPQSANNLLKRTDVGERVKEIQSLAAQSSAEAVILNRERVLNRLSQLSHEAQQKGQYSAAARCEELIGKAIGMFDDRSDLLIPWDGDLAKLNDRQLEGYEEYLVRRLLGTDDPKVLESAQAQIEAGKTVIDVEVEPAQVEPRST